MPVAGQEKGESVVRQRVSRVESVRLSPAIGQMEVPVPGWVIVRLRADQGAESSEELVFLCNEIR